MNNLVIILGGLFVALFIVVKITERFGKPMEEEQMNKMGGIITILLIVMVIFSVIKFFF